MTFNELQLVEPILQALNEEGYTNPTQIQENAIPIILKGTDLLGCAQTGTGKTAAFAIPIIQMLSAQPREKGIKALIVTPTRELAIQIGESFASYGRHLKIRHTVIFGGVNQNPQINALRNGVDVLVATPGRLLDLVGQGFIKLNQLQFFVLDEADRMLDMGFVNDVKKILKIIPDKRQSLFFSATMPPTIMQLASSILTDPERVEVTPVSSTAEIITQEVYFVDKKNKSALLVDVLQDTSIKAALVFTRTKHGADRVVRFLEKSKIKAASIHGNKSQNARQKALSNFKTGDIRVLVATDIAARGIDIEELAFVVNYELPNIPETYVHRIGRTGRAGNAGKAISFCDFEEKEYLKDIEKLIQLKINVNDAHFFPMEVFEVLKTEKQEQPKRFERQNSNQPKAKSKKPNNRNFKGRSGNSSGGEKRNIKK
jgi:ATP-dependent RNA helicase RhlE